MAENETRQGLASVGIKVTVGGTEINNVTGIGEIGGEPNSLDATTFNDKMSKSVPGVQKNDGFNIDFLFDNTSAASDYRRLRKLDGQIVPIEVEFPDGTVFASAGYVTPKVNGTKVNELISATAVCNLQTDWDVTDPSSV